MLAAKGKTYIFHFIILLSYHRLKVVVPTDDEEEEIRRWIREDVGPTIQPPLDFTIDEVLDYYTENKKCKKLEKRASDTNSNTSQFLSENELEDLLRESELRCIITGKRVYFYTLYVY